MRLATCLALLALATLSTALPGVRRRRDVQEPDTEAAASDDQETAASTSSRKEKSLEFYDYLRPSYYDIENEVLSRAEPQRHNFPDSPIYYIRLPPTPYMFVPGLGYVSPPPQNPPMNPFINLPLDFVSNGKPTNIYQWSAPGNNFQKPMNKPNVNFVSNGKPTSVYRPKPSENYNPPPIYRPAYRPKPEYNIDFVSNGKPTGIYQPPYDTPSQATLEFVNNGKPSTMFRPSYEDSVSPDDSPIYRPVYQQQQKPKPDSSVFNINKGPYVFNGRPTDMYLLRNSYNALYEDALQNFYP